MGVQKNRESADRNAAANENRLGTIKDSWGWDGRSLPLAAARHNQVGIPAILSGFVSIVGVS